MLQVLSALRYILFEGGAALLRGPELPVCGRVLSSLKLTQSLDPVFAIIRTNTWHRTVLHTPGGGGERGSRETRNKT